MSMSKEQKWFALVAAVAAQVAISRFVKHQAASLGVPVVAVSLAALAAGAVLG